MFDRTFPARRSGLAAVLLTVGAALCFAGEKLDFDKGVDPKPVLKEARSKAAKMPAVTHKVVRRAEKPGDKVWISVGKEDLPALSEEFGLLARRAVASSEIASVYKIGTEELDELSGIMHKRFKKCGGFFAHRTRKEAEADLMEAAGGSVARKYTMDRQAVARPMVERVKEGRITEVISALEGFYNRYYQSDTGVASSSWIRDHWTGLVKGRADVTVESYPHQGWKQDSVILTVRGTKTPGKVVVLGAHQDSIAGYWGGERNRAPGADDDASGVAVLTETIRVMVESGFRPESTVKFMAYAAEEVGLRGSKDIANDFKSGGAKVEGVLQLDMTNYMGSGDGIFLITDNTNAVLNTFLGKLIDEYVGVSWGTTKCGYACSDHASWTRSGFPAAFPFESAKDGMNPHLHTARDTISQSGGHSKHAAKFAKLAVAYMVELAKGGLIGKGGAAAR